MDVRGCGGHLIMATWCAARIHMVVSRSSLAQVAAPCSATFPTPATICNVFITFTSVGGAKVGKLAAWFGM